MCACAATKSEIVSTAPTDSAPENKKRRNVSVKSRYERLSGEEGKGW